jgi:hypothetical protein
MVACQNLGLKLEEAIYPTLPSRPIDRSRARRLPLLLVLPSPCNVVQNPRVQPLRIEVRRATQPLRIEVHPRWLTCVTPPRPNVTLPGLGPLPRSGGFSICHRLHPRSGTTRLHYSNRVRGLHHVYVAVSAFLVGDDRTFAFPADTRRIRLFGDTPFYPLPVLCGRPRRDCDVRHQSLPATAPEPLLSCDFTLLDDKSRILSIVELVPNTRRATLFHVRSRFEKSPQNFAIRKFRHTSYEFLRPILAPISISYLPGTQLLASLTQRHLAPKSSNLTFTYLTSTEGVRPCDVRTRIQNTLGMRMSNRVSPTRFVMDPTSLRAREFL